MFSQRTTDWCEWNLNLTEIKSTSCLSSMETRISSFTAPILSTSRAMAGSKRGCLVLSLQHPCPPQGLQMCGGCCCLFRSFPQRTGEIAQRAMLEEKNAKGKSFSDISYCSRYSKMEPRRGFHIPWTAWSALAPGSGGAWQGPRWAGCQSVALSWFILRVAQECFMWNFFGVELSIQEILALWGASIFAIKEKSDSF